MAIFTYKSRFVNPEGLINQVNDAMPGGTQNSVAGIQVARDPGQLGSYYYLTALEAQMRFGNALYSGLYQYVQVLSTATAAPAQGVAAFWSSLTNAQNYIVTTDESAPDSGLFAGVFLNPVTKGNYGWIQVGGIATVQYKTTIANGAPAIGDVIIIDTAGPSNKFDDPTAQSTAATIALTEIKAIVGTAITLPANNSLGQVLLRGADWTF